MVYASSMPSHKKAISINYTESLTHLMLAIQNTYPNPMSFTETVILNHE